MGKRTKARFADVSEMVNAISDDQEFAREVNERIASREVIKHLMAFRASKGMSQSDVADCMECTQSRISKLENGTDADIRLGDLGLYAHAVGMELRLVFAEPHATIVDEVKFHAFRIKTLLDQLASLAKKDRKIARGVGAFFSEAFFNLLRILQSSAKHLPTNDDGKSLIQIEVQEVHEDFQDCDCGEVDCPECCTT